QRIAEIEDEGSSYVVIVGKEHATGRHGVFGVMDAHGWLIGSERSDQRTIGSRGRIGVNHREKVIALLIEIPGPGKKVMTGSRRLRLLRGKRKHTKQHRDGDHKTWHENSIRGWAVRIGGEA